MAAGWVGLVWVWVCACVGVCEGVWGGRGLGVRTWVCGTPKYEPGQSTGLVIERLRVRIPAGAAGEFSSPESTLCADFYAVSVPPPCYRGGT